MMRERGPLPKNLDLVGNDVHGNAMRKLLFNAAQYWPQEKDLGEKAEY